jgi:pentatricopeptide repeat protein
MLKSVRFAARQRVWMLGSAKSFDGDCTIVAAPFSRSFSMRQDTNKSDEQIFEAIASPNTIAYNKLINTYAQKGDVKKALDVFHRMQLNFKSTKNKQYRPDIHTYNTILNALQKWNRPGAAKKAVQFFHDIPSPDTVTYNTLINIYALQGNVEKALNLVHQMQLNFESGKNKNCRPNVQTYNTILKAMQNSNRSDAIEQAQRLFDAISLPDTVTYNTLISMHALKGSAEKALDLLHQMQLNFESGKNKNCLPNTRTYATILNALQKSNQSDTVERAERIVNDIALPNTVMYTTLLNIYAQNGSVEKALNLVHQMQLDFESGKNKNCLPDMHTYATVLNALQKSKRFDAAEIAEKLFNAIELPNTVLYTTLINIYAQTGRVQKALDLVHQMHLDFESGKNKNCLPNMHTYGTVLNALQKSNQSDAAEQAERLFNVIPMPNTITYTTLINIHAKLGNGKAAIALTRRMQSDFDFGKNPHCRPNDVTKRTLKKAMFNAKDSTLSMEAQDVFDWFYKQPAGK